LQGDENSWNELMDYITPLILSICKKNNLSREESCDVFGQVSYKLLKNLKKIKSAGKLLQYVRTITINETINLYRRTKLDHKATKHVYDTIYHLKPLNPEEIFEYSARIERLMDALARLPKREYQLLKALFLEQEETSYKEISEQLGIPVSSIGPTRARGLSRLQTILSEKKQK
jgi:RNA polymerase sigma factor (sigma-70 family)